MGKKIAREGWGGQEKEKEKRMHKKRWGDSIENNPQFGGQKFKLSRGNFRGESPASSSIRFDRPLQCAPSAALPTLSCCRRCRRLPPPPCASLPQASPFRHAKPQDRRDPSRHLQESPGPPLPKSPKNLRQRLFGGLQKSPRKYRKIPQKAPNVQF